MWIEHEDYERVKELDEMFLQEKEQEMFVEWQCYVEEQERRERLPARIEMLKPIPKKRKHEYKTDTVSFPRTNS